MATVGWVLKRSINYGKGTVGKKSGRPSYYLTTAKGRRAMETFVNMLKRKTNSSNIDNLMGYLKVKT